MTFQLIGENPWHGSFKHFFVHFFFYSFKAALLHTLFQAIIKVTLLANAQLERLIKKIRIYVRACPG